MGSVWDERDDSSLNELEFEWHPLKAAANVKKHAVSFDEAKTIFGARNIWCFLTGYTATRKNGILLLDARSKIALLHFVSPNGVRNYD